MEYEDNLNPHWKNRAIGKIAKFRYVFIKQIYLSISGNEIIMEFPSENFSQKEIKCNFHFNINTLY